MSALPTSSTRNLKARKKKTKMWVPFWLVCIGVTCQQLELKDELLFKTHAECIKFAQDAAGEFAKDYDRVGYKCVKSDKV